MQNGNFSAGSLDGSPTPPVAGKAMDLARSGAEQAKQIGRTTKERALKEFDSRRQSFAGEVEKLAGTLEEQSSGSEMAPVLDFVASAARRLAAGLKDNTAEQLLQTVYRNPVAILGGTFALGFFVTRLFKA